MITREIPQNEHTFVLLDSTKMGNLITPGLVWVFFWVGKDTSFLKGLFSEVMLASRMASVHICYGFSTGFHPKKV